MRVPNFPLCKLAINDITISVLNVESRYLSNLMQLIIPKMAKKIERYQPQRVLVSQSLVLDSHY